MKKDRIPYITEYVAPSLAFLLTIIGVFFAIDAGYARSMHAGHGNLPPEFYSQMEGWVVGIVAAALIARLNVKIVKRSATLFWVVVLAFLFLARYSPLKIIKSGAARWIHFGPIVIQPAELAKLGAILFVASILAFLADDYSRKKKEGIKNPQPQTGVIVFSTILLIVGVFLVEKEPDLGTAGVIAATCLIMMVAGGVRWKTVSMIALVLALGGLVFVMSKSYRMTRFLNHGSQWSAKNVDGAGFQQLQAKVSMAYGGITGVGIANGRAKHVIPAPTTDFVMATVAEETGFLGAGAILLLLAILCWRLIVLAVETESTFASLVLVGIAAWLAIQGCTNLLQANDTLPAIGIPFPFISSGGSSLTILWMAIGTIQAVLRPAPSKQAEEVANDRLLRRRNGRAYLSRS